MDLRWWKAVCSCSEKVPNISAAQFHSSISLLITNNKHKQAFNSDAKKCSAIPFIPRDCLDKKENCNQDLLTFMLFKICMCPLQNTKDDNLKTAVVRSTLDPTDIHSKKYILLFSTEERKSFVWNNMRVNYPFNVSVQHWPKTNGISLWQTVGVYCEGKPVWKQ